MKFSYNWLKELVGFKESPAGLAEFLTLRAFEVEGVEKAGSDWALDITLLPNRVADASGHIGMAREIAALKNSNVEIRNPKLVESTNAKTIDVLKTVVENQEDCPRYTARVIDGVNVGQSPEWVRKRLTTCGLQPINNLVDAANYVMLETGQPLHVFDFDKLKIKGNRTREIPNDKLQITKTILVRRARKGERIAALDEKTYELNPEILVIADEEEPIAIAGVKGGKESGVSGETKTIVLESANFDPRRIRKGSRLLGLRTDASYRFEHGLDPNSTEAAIDRLAALIANIAKGKILDGRLDLYPTKASAKHVPLRVEYANRLLGIKFAALTYEAALRRVGFPFTKRRRGEYHVEVPTIRRDIELEEDIIEEVARVWGYDKILPQKPVLPLAIPEQNEERYWEDRVRDFLVGKGFIEVFQYIFTGEQELRTFWLESAGLIEIQNPLSADLRFLQKAALPGLVRSAKENEAHHDSIRTFGITKCFSKGKGGVVKGVDERKRLALVWSEKSKSGDEPFFLLKGIVDELFDALGLTEHWYDDAIDPATRKEELSFFHPYRVAEIKIDNEKVGVIGELHPEVRNALQSKHARSGAELDVEKLIMLAEKEAEYIPVSRFPSVRRDIAVVVPEEEKTERVTDVIENTGGKLLVDSDLFDYFQDEAMRKGRKKSLAFHLIFQSPERTLTDAEIDRIYQKIVLALKEKGWVVRD